jgi:putative oxidoreductase
MTPDAVVGIGRIAIGLCFMTFGLTKLLAVRGTTNFVGKVLPMPQLVFWLVVAIETLLGLALVLGLWVAPISWFLAFYCLFIAVFFHFARSDRVQRDQLLKNVVMAAAFAMLAVHGPGAFAVGGL